MKTGFVVPGLEETRECSSNGHYSLDPMKTGKQQKKSVESLQQQHHHHHLDNSSDNDYANYDAHSDDEKVYECIDDIKY